MRNKIFQHNVLKPWPLPDRSVDCIVTSPPYWGLRDYQTGTWMGGDETCDHKPGSTPGLRGLATSTLNGGTKTTGHQQEGYKSCPRCGAVRVDDQLGMEDTPEEYVVHLVQVFAEAWRVLKDTGTLWLNLGDSYARNPQNETAPEKNSGLHTKNGSALTAATARNSRQLGGLKPKNLVGIPWMTAFALRAAGWYLRQDNIWHKPNPMPESVTDRCTKSHEYLFLLTKSRDYYYDAEAIKEPLAASSVLRLAQDIANQTGTTRANGGAKTNGNFKAVGDLGAGTRNKRSVWTVATVPFDGEYCTACGRYFDGPTKKLIRITEEEGKTVRTCPCGCDNAWLSHFATFPPDLIVDCVKAGTSQHGNCVACGKPWERIVESEYKTHENWYGDHGLHGKNSRGAAGTSYHEKINTITKGWQPTCACGTAEVLPAIVADCFMGSGTTGLVAREQGRDYVGLDLNPHYIAMAEARLAVGIQAELSF